MILPPVVSAAVVVKPRVTETPALAAIRSVADMLKETAVTEVAEGAGGEGAGTICGKTAVPESMIVELLSTSDIIATVGELAGPATVGFVKSVIDITTFDPLRKIPDVSLMVKMPLA